MVDENITLKEYLGEKIDEIKDSIRDLKSEIRTNQAENQSKILKIEDDLSRRISNLEFEINEIRFIKKYWKVFVIALIVFALTSIFQLKNTFKNEFKANNTENTVRQ